MFWYTLGLNELISNCIVSPSDVTASTFIVFEGAVLKDVQLDKKPSNTINVNILR